MTSIRQKNKGVYSLSSVSLRSRRCRGGGYSEDCSIPDPPDASDECPLSRNSPVSAHTEIKKKLNNFCFRVDLKARIYKKTFLAVYYVITILSVFLFELSVQAYIIMWFELNHDDDRSVKGVWLTHCVTFSFCTYSNVLPTY